MAIYHFSMRHIARGAGRSATAAAAYRAGLAIADERTGETHDYARRQGVLNHALLTPSRAPTWAKDSASLWNAAEVFEKRKDARLAREVIVALPHELSLAQNRELLHGYVQEAFVARGMAAQVDIHGPDREGDGRNVHAHILLTVRQITRNGFKEKKPEVWNGKATLLEWREQWAEHINRALERAGHKERVTAKSFKNLGIEDREPTKHLGPAASQMERRGVKTRIGEENRAAREFNRLKAQAKVIDLAVERARRALAAERERQTAEAGQQASDAASAREQRGRKRAEPETRKDFSEGANRARAALQNRQLEQQANMGRLHHEQRAAQAAQLEMVYGAAKQAARAALREIEQRQQERGIKEMLYRLSGQARTDEAQAEARRNELRDIARREEEERGKLALAQAAERAGQAGRHDRERAELEREIEARGREPEPAALSERTREARDRERGEGRERQRGMER